MIFHPYLFGRRRTTRGAYPYREVFDSCQNGDYPAVSADRNRPGYIHVPAPCRQVRKCCSLMESALRERQGKFYDVVLCHIIISCITMILFTYIHVLVSSWSAWFSKPHTMEAHRPVWYDCSRLLGNRIPKYLGTAFPALGTGSPDHCVSAYALLFRAAYILQCLPKIPKYNDKKD